MAKPRYGVDAHYWPKDFMPFIYCSACLTIARELSPDTDSLFKEIVQLWEKPTYQTALEEIRAIPFKQLFRSVITRSILLLYKRIVSRFFKSYKPSLPDYFPGPIKEVVNRYKDDEEFETLLVLIDRLILIGFNREGHRDFDTAIIRPVRTSWLFWVVFLGTLIECLQKRPDWDELTQVHYRGGVYDISHALEGVTNNRLHRRRTKAFKSSDWSLHQDKKVLQIVEHWYACRVIYSGIEEYMRFRSDKDERDYDSSNISHEIHDCDLAMGYPRTSEPKS